MLNKFLFKHIDNSALIVFRIIFGLLALLESIGAIFTGWVRQVLIEPKFTFNFIGFEFLQPLPGQWMYLYYVIMGCFALFIMLGYKYRLSIIMFTLMWTTTYLMQKSSYNNHYYLLSLLSVIMVFLPANTYASLDAKYNPEIKKTSMPIWCKWIFVIQLLIMYSYASIAKLYPDWLDLTIPTQLMKSKINTPIIGESLQHWFTINAVAYGGILYDGLIIPFLLFKRTRRIALCCSIFFHLFNSFVFLIGIFPYLALSFSLFFFPPKTIRNIFLNKKPFYSNDEVIVPSYKPTLLAVASVYIMIQLALPLRHHFIEDNVLWTEEGHRLSWRMMLRSKSGRANYTVINKETNKKTNIKLDDYLTKKQQKIATIYPDVIWQFAQHLKQEYAAKSEDVSVFVDCKVRLNGRPYKRLIDPKIDIAAVDWTPLKHSDWILASELDK